MQSADISQQLSINIYLDVIIVSSQLRTSVQYFSKITLKDFQYTDSGDLTCSFGFPDNHNSEFSVTTVYATVTAEEECVFVDYRVETVKTLRCKYLVRADSKIPFVFPVNADVRVGY